jgi:UTP:GlnB (protein PII) uridylyltransferase
VTERGAAIDSFYVCERNGRKIESADRQETIKARLLKAVNKLEAAV